MWKSACLKTSFCVHLNNVVLQFYCILMNFKHTLKFTNFIEFENSKYWILNLWLLTMFSKPQKGRTLRENAYCESLWRSYDLQCDLRRWARTYRPKLDGCIVWNTLNTAEQGMGHSEWPMTQVTHRALDPWPVWPMTHGSPGPSPHTESTDDWQVHSWH